MLQHALDLADMGFAVFPVGPDCRIPKVPGNDGKGGVWLASRNHEKIRTMDWTRSNVAVATGYASGVFVLDIDVKNADGFKSVEGLGLLPTWRSKTPSGGEHWWFKQPVRDMRNRVNFLPGLDIRTNGGSVAVPPSRKPNGPYEWIVAPWACELGEAPAAFLNLIDPPLPPPRPIPKHGGERYAMSALANEAARVAQTRAGRNQTLFVAAANLGRFVAAGKLHESHVIAALEDACRANGLLKEDGPRQIAATISSGLSRGSARSDVSPEMRFRLDRQRTG